MPPPFVYFDSERNKIDIGEFSGRIPVVISFFATYCQPCKNEIPFLLEQTKRNAYRLILVVTDTGDRVKIKKFLDGINVSFPFIYDPFGRIVKNYEIKDLPHTVYIGKSGRVVSVEKGFIEKKKAYLVNIIKSLGEK